MTPTPERDHSNSGSVMTSSDLRRVLEAIPEPVVDPSAAVMRGIADSLRYLASDAALFSIELDPYWPKWHSPWWHALLLLELGEGARVPARTTTALVERLEALPLHTFPIHAHEFPPGTDPQRDILCHCALGCIAQVLAGCGVDVPRALPWVAPWFPRYQMADGGLNCDNAAYLVTGPCPSSMVGTIAPFEAMGELDVPGRSELAARAAQFMIGRALTRGSESEFNAEERSAAHSWPELTFPRFYFYDTLRGLAALVAWAEQENQSLPLAAVAPTAAQLSARFPDGVLRVERHAFAGRNTLVQDAPGVRVPASTFPLLEAASELGSKAPALTRQWTTTRRGLLRLLADGRLSEASSSPSA